jgi:hypothetical protein
LVSRAIAQSLVPGMDDDDMPFFWVCYMVENGCLKNKREIVEKFP